MSPQRKELSDEITKVAENIATMITPLADTEIQIKKSRWTVRTAASHLVISQTLSKSIIQGGKNPYKNANPEVVAAANSQLLKKFPRHDYNELGTLLIETTKVFLAATQKLKDEYIFKTHFGEMNLLTCLSYNLCHLLIHGSQIAIALKKPLPLQERSAVLSLAFIKHVMPVTYDVEKAKEFVAKLLFI